MNNYLFTFNAEQLSQQLQPYSENILKKLKRPSSVRPNLLDLKHKQEMQNINQLFETEQNKSRQKCKTSNVNRKKANIKLLQSLKNNIQFEIPNLEHLRLIKNQSSKENQSNLANLQANLTNIQSNLANSQNTSNLANAQNQKPERQNCIKQIEPSYSQQLNYPTSKTHKLFGIQLQIFNGRYQKKQSFMKKMSIGKVSQSKQKKIKLGMASPKILYPQSDRKLPSVFKIRSVKQSPSSIRNRVNSSKTIAESIENQIIFHDSLKMDPLIRTKFRPQSMMISTSKKQIMKDSIKIPKKLIFDQIQNTFFQNAINKKVQDKINNRKNHIYRKLKQLPISQFDCQNKDIKQSSNNNQNQESKNKELHDSKQHVSTTQTIQTPKPKTKLRQKLKKAQNQQQKKFQLTCSITFQMDKSSLK